MYSFERRQNNATPGVQIAKEQDLAGWVRWALSKEDTPDGPVQNTAVVSNFQVIYLSGREHNMRTAVAREDDFFKALSLLETLPFFGIVELFDESMREMKQYVARDFGVMDTSHRIENRSPDRKPDIAERLREIKTALGAELYQEVLDRNVFDLKLYETALEIFKTRDRH